MTIKVYFAASIRGGRDHASKYQDIIAEINNYGTVLTEHFSDMTLTQKGTHSDEKHIFKIDTNWIQEAKVIIAEVSQPSLGVGYELGYAESLKKPILCLYQKQKDKKLSAMITGNPYFTTKEYEELIEAKKAIKKFMEMHV